MSNLTGGEALVKSLLAQGVDTIFGLPGVQSDYFYNAVYDVIHKDGANLRVIHPRHEQGAAYMALGYALATGGVGVYNVVPGPGVLNTTAALSTAYGLNAQVLCVAGQIPSGLIGRSIGQLHEIPDQLGVLRSLTKWAARIDTPADAPTLVAEAFRQMASGRTRPAALEIPMDVLAARSAVDLRPPTLDVRVPPIDQDAIDRAAQMLAEAENPVIFVGSGAVGATDAVRELAETFQVPVVASYTGRGILDSRHPLSLTMPAGYMLWEQADVVLAVGTRLYMPLRSWGVDDDLKIIRIDIDPTEHARVTPPALHITARSEDALPALVDAVAALKLVRTSRLDEMADLKAEVEGKMAYLEPQIHYVQAIRAALPDDGILVDDLTQIGYVSRFALPVYQPRTYLTTGYQGTLGWSFATALGAKVARPEQQVLSVTGDGGFMFTMQELATAVQHGINTVTVVFNDGAYGNVRRMQRDQHGGRVIASDLRNPDFVALAESFGALGLRAESPDEVHAAIRQGFDAGVPTLIDAPIGETPSPWPMVFGLPVRGK